MRTRTNACGGFSLLHYGVIIPPSLGNLARIAVSMARRIFKFDKTLQKVVEVTYASAESGSLPYVSVKNATANKRRFKSVAQWPMVSENAGCSPEQVPEANEACKRHGIRGVEYMPSGDVVWSSPEAKKRHIRSIGLYDRDAYTS